MTDNRRPTTEHYERVRELFFRALDVPAAEQRDFVAGAHDYDPAVRNSVLELLAASTPSPDIPAEEAPGPAGGDPLLQAADPIPGYRLLGVIGRGGMGTVYHAVSNDTGAEVAVKVLRSVSATDTERSRFAREAKALERLDHRSIARSIDTGFTTEATGARPFVVMDLVNGVSLDEHLAAEDPSVDARVRLLTDVADALAHAHARGVIHRDIKPQNIIVDGDGIAHVVDFGVARVGGHATTMLFETSAGALVGTVQYMSPEQVQADDDGPDQRTDIYSLGIVAFEALTGKLPYELRGKPLAEAIITVLRAEPNWPALGETLPGDLLAILRAAMHKDPAQRYQTMGDFAADLRNFLAGRPVTARRRLRRSVRRRNIRAAGFAAVVIAAVIAGWWVARNPPSSSASVTLTEVCEQIDEIDRRRHHDQLTNDDIRALIPDVHATLKNVAKLPGDQTAAELRRYLMFRLGELHYFLGSSEYSLSELETARDYWVQSTALPDSAAIAGITVHDGLRKRMLALMDHKPFQAVALASDTRAMYEEPLRYTQAALSNRITAWNRFTLGMGRYGVPPLEFPLDTPERDPTTDVGLLLNELGISYARAGYLSNNAEDLDHGIALLERVHQGDFLRPIWDARSSSIHNLALAYLWRGRIRDDVGDIQRSFATAREALEMRTYASNLRSHCATQRVVADCSAALLDHGESVAWDSLSSELGELTDDLSRSGARVDAALLGMAHGRLLRSAAKATGDDQPAWEALALADSAAAVLTAAFMPYQHSRCAVLKAELCEVLSDGDGASDLRDDAVAAARQSLRLTAQSEDVTLGRRANAVLARLR